MAEDDDAIAERLFMACDLLKAELTRDGLMPSQTSQTVGGLEQQAVTYADRHFVYEELCKRGSTGHSPDEAEAITQAYSRRHPTANPVWEPEDEQEGAAHIAVYGFGPLSDLIVYLKSGRPISPWIAKPMADLLEGRNPYRKWIEIKSGRGRKEITQPEILARAREARAYFDNRLEETGVRKQALADTIAAGFGQERAVEEMLRQGRTITQMVADAQRRARRCKE